MAETSPSPRINTMQTITVERRVYPVLWYWELTKAQVMVEKTLRRDCRAYAIVEMPQAFRHSGEHVMLCGRSLDGDWYKLPSSVRPVLARMLNMIGGKVTTNPATK